MPAPKAIVFDLGKVLVDFDYTVASRRLAARSEASPQAIRDFIDHSPLLVELETGRMPVPEFFEAVRVKARFRGDAAEFARIFADIFTPMEPMIALHARLKARGVPCHIFSNTNSLAVEHIRSAFPFFNGFDSYILSFEIGAMKPDPRIYEALENRSGFSGADLLYLDDRAENIAVGAARGWRTHLQADTAEAIRAVEVAMGWGPPS